MSDWFYLSEEGFEDEYTETLLPDSDTVYATSSKIPLHKLAEYVTNKSWNEFVEEFKVDLDLFQNCSKILFYTYLKILHV